MDDKSKKTFTTPEGIYNSGGTRKAIKLDDEIAYPLILDEYAVIKEKIHDVNLDTWQTLLLSSGITFSIAVIISYFTYDIYEYIKIDNHDKKVLNATSLFVIAFYLLLSIASFIGFGLSYKYKKALNNSFKRIDKKILKTLNSGSNEIENTGSSNEDGQVLQ